MIPVKDEELLRKLSERLVKFLPGEKAQYLMAPASRFDPKYFINYNGPPRMSSVLIMLFKHEHQWKIPLIERPHNTGMHSGQMALPGGKSEEGDQDRIQTALREAEEEIGVSVGDIEVLGTLTELHVQASHNTVLPVVSYKPSMPEFKPDPEEVASLHLVSIEELMNEKNCQVTEFRVSDHLTIEAPYYDVQGKMVWGATAMILSEFLYILHDLFDGDQP